MTEKDFWTKYFRAEYLHSTKNAVAAAAEAAEDEELAIFLKDDDILADAARQKVLFLRVGVSLFFFTGYSCIILYVYLSTFTILYFLFADSTG